jgi:hypothetical protein
MDGTFLWLVSTASGLTNLATTYHADQMTSKTDDKRVAYSGRNVEFPCQLEILARDSGRPQSTFGIVILYK